MNDKLKEANEILKEVKEITELIDSLEETKSQTSRKNPEYKKLRITIKFLKVALIATNKKLPVAKKLIEEVKAEQMHLAQVQPHEI